LYITIIPKWSDHQFRQFIKILKDTGNEKAHEIFTIDGAEVFLTRDQVELLKVQMKLWNENSIYQGFCMDDEIIANSVQGYLNDGKLYSGDKFQLHESLRDKRREVVPLLKKFVSVVQENRVWINPSKTQLPDNNIERKVRRNSSVSSLVEIVMEKQNKLIVLADGPGMGKSCALTKLEMDLRRNPTIPFPRVIIRKNLNQCSKFLKQVSSQTETTLSIFIKQFADFVPDWNEDSSVVPVYVLLDGLDEVLPLYKKPMMSLLNGLLKPSPESANINNGYDLEMVVLTTRPHLTKMIQNKFGINACTLIPLSDQEQIEYLTKQVEILGQKGEAEMKLKELPKSARSLMSNPLMLHLYSQVCADRSSGMLDVYSLYTKFMEKKHEVYISEKEHGDLDSQPTVWRKKQLLDINLAYYLLLLGFR